MDSSTKCSFFCAFLVSRFPMIAQTELPLASRTRIPTILLTKLETGRQLTGRTAVSSSSSSVTNCQTGCFCKSETWRNSTDLVSRMLVALGALYATKIIFSSPDKRGYRRCVGTRWYAGLMKQEKRFAVIQVPNLNWPVLLQIPSRRFRLFVAADVTGVSTQAIADFAVAALNIDRKST